MDSFPQRIVSLQPSATVILASLGKLDLLVACTKYCADVCPQLRETPRVIVSDSWTAKSAEILAAHPDLLIAAVPYQEQAVIEILKSGIRFLGLAPKTLADIYGDIACISGIVGNQQGGQQVISEMKSQMETVHQQTRDLLKPRVFCEEWGKPLIASQPWVAELVEAAGGKFVGTPGAQITPEEVLAADPDVLVAAWCGAGNRVPLEKIIHERSWLHLQAAQKRRVHCIPDEFLNTPAPTLILGLKALAAVIHPERFSLPSGIRTITEVPVNADQL